MISLTIDGQKVEVEEGGTFLQVAPKADLPVFFFTELTGLIFALGQCDRWFNMHLVDSRSARLYRWHLAGCIGGILPPPRAERPQDCRRDGGVT